MRSLAASWRVLLAGSLAGLAIVMLAAANPLSFFEIAELKALDAQFRSEERRVGKECRL